MPARSQKQLEHSGVLWSASAPPQEVLLHLLQTSLDDVVHGLDTWAGATKPETLHQARVAWRRFKCLCRFYRHMLPEPARRLQHVRQAIWQRTSAVRNLDVSLAITLPAWRQNHPDTAPQEWPTLIRHLQGQRRSARRNLQNALSQAEALAGWLELRAWIKGAAESPQKQSAHAWRRKTHHRLDKLHQKIKHGRKTAKASKQHTCRLLIKQERYVLEGLAPHALSHTLSKRLKRSRQFQNALGQDQDQRVTLGLIESSGLFSALSRAWRASL
jgi:CHAD domain-containing protein